MSGRVNYWPVACQEILCPVIGILLHADLLPAIPQPATEIIFQASPVSCLSGNTMSIHRNDNSIQIPVDYIELRHSDRISVDFMEFRQCHGWIWNFWQCSWLDFTGKYIPWLDMKFQIMLLSMHLGLFQGITHT
jgi:hypothetical protein